MEHLRTTPSEKRERERWVGCSYKINDRLALLEEPVFRVHLEGCEQMGVDVVWS